jgi:hypothetical protein
VLILKLLKHLVPTLGFKKIGAPIIAENLLGLEILYGVFVDWICVNTDNPLVNWIDSVID